MSPPEQKIPWETYSSCIWVLIKMVNILQLKYIYMALVNSGNWSWETSCPLWPEQSKHPIFNTVSDSLAHNPSPQAKKQTKRPTNQPHISLQRDNKRNSRGTKGAEASWEAKCKMSGAEIRNLNFAALSCQVDQAQSRSPGVTRTVMFVCFVVSLPTTQ